MRSKPTLHLFVTAIALTALLCPIAPCLAQDQGTARDADARRLFDAAQVMFEDGRFEEAGRMFERAYELSGRSEMLYNAYVAYRDGQAPDAAIRVLRLYLAQPDAQFRPRLEQRLAALEAARGDGPPSPTPQPPEATAEPAPPPETESDATPHVDPASVAVAASGDAPTTSTTERAQRRAPHPMGPALVALGTLSVVAGGAVGGVAVRDARRLQSRCPGGSCAAGDAPLIRRAERRADVSTALLSAGGVVAVAGGILWRVVRREADDVSAPPLTVAIGRGGASILVQGVLR